MREVEDAVVPEQRGRWALSHHMEGGAGPKCRSNTHSAVGIATHWLFVPWGGWVSAQQVSQPQVPPCPYHPLRQPVWPSLAYLTLLQTRASPCPVTLNPPEFQMGGSLTAGGWELPGTQCRAW